MSSSTQSNWTTKELENSPPGFQKSKADLEEGKYIAKKMAFYTSEMKSQTDLQVEKN